MNVTTIPAATNATSPASPSPKPAWPPCATTPSWRMWPVTMRACNRGWRSTSTSTRVKTSTTAGAPSPSPTQANNTAAWRKKRSAAAAARPTRCRPQPFAGPPTGKPHCVTNPASTARRLPQWSARPGKRFIAMNGAGSRCSSRGIARTKTTTRVRAGFVWLRAGRGRPGAPWPCLGSIRN
ncbi:hypothetical protein D3C76_1185930 [compost metagenome]